MYLDKKEDLENCMLACKLWNSAASKLFRGRTAIKIDNILKTSDQFLEFPEDNPALGSIVENVKFGTIFDFPPQFKPITSQLNYLKQLYAISNQLGRYLEALSSQEVNLSRIKKLEPYLFIQQIFLMSKKHINYALPFTTDIAKQ